MANEFSDGNLLPPKPKMGKDKLTIIILGIIIALVVIGLVTATIKLYI